MNSPRSFRTTELAKEFARQGHEVTVITPFNDVHLDYAKKNGLRIKDLGLPTWKSVEIRGRGARKLLLRAIKRFSNLLFQYPDIELMRMVKRALQKEKDEYDLLISIAVPYPVHWGVARVWKKKGKKNPARVWIADCGDPFMGQENDSFKLPFYFGWVEKWFMRKADFVTVPAPTAIAAYYPEFHDKIRVIPQGFCFEDIQQNGEPAREDSDIPHFAYAGAFIPGRRDPRELLEYLVNLDTPFKFDIYTTHSDLVRPWAEKSEGRIQLKDYMPRHDLLQQLSKCSFLVNFENIGNRQIPSKLIDYAILNKPVLSVTTGNLDIEGVNQFLRGDYQKRYVISNPTKYRIEKVAAKFISLTQN